MTAEEPADATWLLSTARAFVDGSADGLAGRWPRAAALLARQALETRLAALCAGLDPAVARCDRRAQLLCLQAVVDAELARDVAHTWAALSHACHHHPYDLAPTAVELRGWFDHVARLLDTAP